jgi:predicted nucleic acid-binding protein
MDALLDAISELGLSVVYDFRPPLLDRAGRLKAERRRVSLADCVALGLALEHNRWLVTTDHREFDPLAADGFPIIFAR